MSEEWFQADSPEERAVRREAYLRLASAAQRVGLPLEKLASMLRQVAQNEAETRRFLAQEVYGAPDDILDELIRVRLSDLEKREEP